MRHQVAGKHLGRTSAHRRILRRNLASSLFEHGTISTTLEKAKFVKPFAEKLITLARDGSLHARRRAISLLNDRAICKIEEGESVKETTVIRRLFSEIGPRFADRNGGYTRIIRLPWRRIGDNGKLVLLQLVGEQQTSTSKSAVTKSDTAAEPESPVEEAVASQPEADVAGDDAGAETQTEKEADKE